MEANTNININKEVVLCYKQRERKPNIWVERFGIKELVFQIGFTDYEQEEVVNLNDVEKRIKELSSFSNRSYHSFKTKQII